ncbi:MAG TPA: hypothetical protein VIC51_12020, partial [Psychromonas sp.]
YSNPATASLGGKISQAINMVESGHATTFNVTPDTGYQIDDISGCGGSLTQNSYKTAVINAQCTVTVSFKLSTYKITTQATTGGQISPESIDVSYNTNTSFTISRDIGYQIGSETERSCMVAEGMRAEDQKARIISNYYCELSREFIKHFIAQKHPEKAEELANYVVVSLQGLSAAAFSGLPASRVVTVAELAGISISSLISS